ncbi:hypothetical protein Z950_3711 [Sulfitobacter mediterraneus KCTC 32188]|nr:hypothetical protein Z950_3711 [Sulfitobacter mediterraneus KCTC 32188]
MTQPVGSTFAAAFYEVEIKLQRKYSVRLPSIVDDMTGRISHHGMADAPGIETIHVDNIALEHHRSRSGNREFSITVRCARQNGVKENLNTL